MVYLDNAATTPLDPRVLEVMLPWLQDGYGNPSSIHGKGREARSAVEEARAKVAELLDAEPSEIVFTGCGTEADNAAIAAAADNQGRDEIISVPTEHHAVLHAVQRWSGRQTWVSAEPDGSVNPARVAERISSSTALVSVMHVNNETGAINDIASLATLSVGAGAFFHTDAVQSAGKLPLSSRAIPFDYASLAAHKMHGPKGCGALYIRTGRPAPILLRGGGQERGRRAGTENVASIVGFGEAARLALGEMKKRQESWKALRFRLLTALHQSYHGIVVNAVEGRVLDAIVSVTFPWDRFGLDGESLLIGLDLEGVALSSGSACTSGSIHASHVMLAAGHDTRSAAATLRFSFGVSTSEQDVDEALSRLRRVIDRMREA